MHLAAVYSLVDLPWPLSNRDSISRMLIPENENENRHVRSLFFHPSVRTFRPPSQEWPWDARGVHARIKDHRNERDKGMPTVLSFQPKKRGEREKKKEEKVGEDLTSPPFASLSLDTPVNASRV